MAAGAAEIWIYRDPGLPYLIAKRTPFQYQLFEGNGSRRLLQGVAIPTPVWSEMRQHATTGQVLGHFAETWYDITDLFSMKNPSPP